MSTAKTVVNASGGDVVLPDLLPPVAGGIVRRPYIIHAGVTVDLSTVCSREESTACAGLDEAIAAGSLTVSNSYPNTSESEEIQALHDYIMTKRSVVEFNDETVSGVKEGTNVIVEVVDAHAGSRIYCDNETHVTVTITGGSATGKKIDGVAGPTVYTMVDGKVTIAVSATGAGNVTLGLSASDPSLTQTSTCTVTLS